MTSHALSRDTLMPNAPEGAGRGIGLSLLVHVGLVVAIAFGVSWRIRTPESQQAELWAAVPQAAAARAIEPEPVIAPKPAPPPPPAPAPVARPVPKMEAPPAPPPDAQIAIEKARAEKIRKEEQVAEREREILRKEKQAAERERELQRKKLEAEQAAAEKLRQQQQEAEALKKQQAAEQRQAQQREADRKKNIERMLGQAGATGDAGATGSALRSAGPSAGYTGRIVARVRPNIFYPDRRGANATAEVQVRAAPDGTILGRTLVKSSGVPAWDSAVLRALDKTEVLPRDIDGRVPGTLLLVFRSDD